MKGKVCFLGMLIGVLVLSGCGGNPNAKSKVWKNYTNEKYGYSFAYPPDCHFGPMPTDCKEKPPEARRAECFCFLDAVNPDQVFLQTFTGERDTLTGVSFSISHFDIPLFHPPEGTEVISWLRDNFAERYEDIPEAPNMDLGGRSAVRLYEAHSPQAFSQETIFYIEDVNLFEIRMLNVDDEANRALYDAILESFRHAEGP